MRAAPRLRLIPVGLAVAIAVNLALLLLFILGQGGQTTVVELRNDNGAFRALTDGKQVVPAGGDLREAAVLNAPERGTIVLVVAPAVPTLHSRGGIDSIVVTGPSGEVLFRDNFDSLNPATWEVLSGEFEVRDGLLVSTTINAQNALLLRQEGWSNYDVRVTYRNTRAGVIGINVTSDGGLYYHFDLLRDFPNFFDVHNEGVGQPGAGGSLMRTGISGPLRSIAHMLARGYPFMLGGLLAGIALVFAVSAARPLAPRPIRLPARDRLQELPLEYAAVAVLALGAFGLTFYLNATYYTFLPHLPDEVAYIFQAHVLARFNVTAEMPPVHEAFYFYFPPFFYEHGDRWASFYPFGHPLMLALGVPLGMVNLVPSLVGAGSVVLTFLVGRRLFDTRTALVAAGLLVVSPFFLMQASSFMSHNTAALYILLALYFILKRERPLLYGLIAGLFFGLGVNTRLLTMVALVPVFGVLMLTYVLIRGEALRPWLTHSVAFVFAVLLLTAAMFLYNQGITGDAFTSAYTGTQGSSSELYGFREGHTLDIGLRNVQAQLMALIMVFNAWPAWVALTFVMLPFILGSRHAADYFLLAAVLFPIAIYLGYRYSGIYEGPRYWYETMPFLVLLSARGASIAADRLTYAAVRVRERLRRGPVPRRWAASVVVYATLGVLVVYGTTGWAMGWHAEEDAPLIPQSAAQIEGLFGVDQRLSRLADELDLQDALVLVRPCGFFQSPSCYGSVFLRNLPDFDGPVVWARYDESLNARTIAAFPGREVYVATWAPVGIERYQGD